MQNELIDDKDLEKLVSAIETGTYIDAKADEKYRELLKHPKVIDALKNRCVS